MDDKDIELFTKPNPEAHARYMKAKRVKRLKNSAEKAKRFCQIVSKIILWICAVGGFALSLIQFVQNQ